MLTGLRRLLTMAILLMCSAGSNALSMNDFASACEAYQGECRNHPFLQAYVGGALDLVAMLDEETSYLEKIYCIEASEFFDAPRIINYMMTNKEDYENKNAMLLVIRFLEEQGGCEVR